MKHRYALPSLALVLAATGCFSTITVGEKIPAPSLEDPLAQRVALRVRAYPTCDATTPACPLVDIYEGDVNEAGTAFEIRETTFRSGDSTMALRPPVATWPRTVPRYPSTVEASAATVEGRSLFLSTYSDLIVEGSRGATYSKLALGETTSVDPSAAAYVQDEGLSATLFLDAAVGAKSRILLRSLTATPVGDYGTPLAGVAVPAITDGARPEATLVGAANAAPGSWATVTVSDTSGTMFVSHDGDAAHTRLNHSIDGGASALASSLRTAAMFRVDRDAAGINTAQVPPAITFSRPNGLIVHSRTTSEQQRISLGEVVGASNLATGPCSAGSQRQCAFLVTVIQNGTGASMTGVLHRFEWTGAYDGSAMVTRTDMALRGAQKDIVLAAVTLPRQQRWHIVIATDGGFVAARFDATVIPDTVGSPNVFERHGLYLFEGATAARLAYRAER